MTPRVQNIVNFKPANKVMIDFCKFILGLGKKSSNSAVLAELGIYPLDIEIKVRIIKYWLRVMSLSDDHILKHSYNNVLELDSRGHRSWATAVRFILQNNGMGNIWLKLNQPENSSVDGSRVLTNLEKRLQDQYQQLFFAKIQDHKVKHGSDTKLRFYRLFKNSYSAEKYLSSVPSFKMRQIFSKFRISNHKLRIETGRYSQEKVSERTCQFCPSSVTEDEFHLLFTCNLYDDIRETLFSSISNTFPTFSSKTDKARAQFLMSVQNPNLLYCVASFLLECFARRDNLLYSLDCTFF